MGWFPDGPPHSWPLVARCNQGWISGLQSTHTVKLGHMTECIVRIMFNYESKCI